MKKSELQKIIKEELQKTLNEDTNATMKTALTALMKDIKSALKKEGVKINKITPQDMETITAEWIMSTVNSGYVSKKLADDMFDNKAIYNIIDKYFDKDDLQHFL